MKRLLTILLVSLTLVACCLGLTACGANTPLSEFGNSLIENPVTKENNGEEYTLSTANPGVTWFDFDYEYYTRLGSCSSTCQSDYHFTRVYADLRWFFKGKEANTISARLTFENRLDCTYAATDKGVYIVTVQDTSILITPAKDEDISTIDKLAAFLKDKISLTKEESGGARTEITDLTQAGEHLLGVYDYLCGYVEEIVNVAKTKGFDITSTQVK